VLQFSIFGTIVILVTKVQAKPWHQANVSAMRINVKFSKRN
jgi:hypothetical protein